MDILEERIIKGNKDINIDGWKLLQYYHYPSNEKPAIIYNLAYWKNGNVVEDTEEFIDNKTIALDFYESVEGEEINE